MNKKNKNTSNSDFKQFIENRKRMSSFDKKLEALDLIKQTTLIDVDKAFYKVISRINNQNKIYLIYTYVTRIAAILTLPLLAFAIWSLFFQERQTSSKHVSHSEITWQEIFSPVGMRSHVVLPDGTNLWLNAESGIKYSIPFIRDKREVELTGEAFFDVVKNDKSPFVVNIADAEVEVLGTQFNVNAWLDSDKITVALKEGSVKFKFQEEESLIRFADMKPNDYLQFDKVDKSVIRTTTNIEKYTAWHQNIMILDDTPMTELAKLLEQWYGVKVVIADEEIKRYRFTTTFNNEPLHRVLELLEISSPGISINYILGEPIKGTKNFSPSIITITKRK